MEREPAAAADARRQPRQHQGPRPGAQRQLPPPRGVGGQTPLCTVLARPLRRAPGASGRSERRECGVQGWLVLLRLVVVVVVVAPPGVAGPRGSPVVPAAAPASPSLRWAPTSEVASGTPGSPLYPLSRDPPPRAAGPTRRARLGGGSGRGRRGPDPGRERRRPVPRPWSPLRARPGRGLDPSPKWSRPDSRFPAPLGGPQDRGGEPGRRLPRGRALLGGFGGRPDSKGGPAPLPTPSPSSVGASGPGAMDGTGGRDGGETPAQRRGVRGSPPRSQGPGP